MECIDPNCTDCTGDTAVCTACKPGFDVVQSACKSKCRYGETYNELDSICKCGAAASCAATSYCDGSGCVSCRTAMPTCKECDAADKCTLYDDPCTVWNCAVCSESPSTCYTCSDGYTLQYNTCVKNCPDGATTCAVNAICKDNATCETCVSGMLNKGNACQCNETACLPSQFCVHDDWSCKYCFDYMPNCEQCTSADKCTKWHRSCQAANCTECDMNVDDCTACAAGFYVVAKRCHYDCGEGSCNVNQYCDSGACKECKSGEYNVSGVCSCNGEASCAVTHYCDSTQCVSCGTSMANCSECTDQDSCTKVKNPCTDVNCAMCESKADVCTLCSYGYNVKDGACVKIPCKVLNCDYCVSDTAVCTKCVQNFTLDNNKCLYYCKDALCYETQICANDVCEKCPGTLQNVGGVCTCGGIVCSNDYYCSGNECVLCSASMGNCAQCTDNVTCTVPKDPCTDANCAMCEAYKQNCTKCVDTFFVTDNVCLQRCTEGVMCTADYICAPDGKCKQCEHGMTNLSGQCKCGEQICDSTQVCITAEAKCQKCEETMYNCLECTSPSVCTKPKTSCTAVNCTMCQNAADTCTACAANFVLTDGKCFQQCGDATCKAEEVCSENTCTKCLANEHNVAGQCGCGFGVRCADGLFCSTDKACSECPGGCSLCTYEACSECKNGYKLDGKVCLTTSNAGVIVAIVVAIIVVIGAGAGLWYYFAVVRRKSSMAAQVDKARSVYPKLTAVQTNQLFI